MWEHDHPGKRLFKTPSPALQLVRHCSEEVPCTILSSLVLSMMSKVLEALLLGRLAVQDCWANKPASEGLKVSAVVVQLFAFVVDCSLMVN